MKMMIVVFFIIFSLRGMAQSNTLEEKLARSACTYIDSLKSLNFTSLEEKKRAISFIFTKSVRDNKKLIESDPRFIRLKDYEQGKKIGELFANLIVPIMINQCPAFRKLL